MANSPNKFLRSKTAKLLTRRAMGIENKSSDHFILTKGPVFDFKKVLAQVITLLHNLKVTEKKYHTPKNYPTVVTPLFKK